MSGGLDNSCIYKSKYDVATYREEAPLLSYGEKVDLTKNVFVPEKTLAFQKQLDLLNMCNYCCFPDFLILPVRMHLTSCLVFCLVMIFLLKPLGYEISFHSTSGLGQVFVLTLELIRKKKKIIPSHISVQNLHFSVWPKLEAILFSYQKIKS